MPVGTPPNLASATTRTKLPSPSILCTLLYNTEYAQCGHLHCFVCAVHFYFPLIRISLWLNDKQPVPLEAEPKRREPCRDTQAQRRPAQIFQTKSACCSPA